MAKVRLTQADKKSLLDIVSRFIKDNTEDYDYDAFIDKRKIQMKKAIQDYLDNAFDMSDDVKKFIEDHNLMSSVSRSGYNFEYFIGEVRYTDTFYFIGKFPDILMYVKPDHFPEDYPDENKIHSYRINDIIYWFLRKYSEEIEKDLQEICKNYNDIYTKFKNIIYSLKYLEDVVQYFDIDAVKTFVNQRLAQSCSTTALISKDDVDFVDNFIKNTKKD